MSDPLNEKSRVLLNSLVEKYIEGGQPVASKVLAGSSMVRVSPATVRSIMAELEELGYVSSPHPSAGKVPTALGYRFFVDSLINVSPLGSYDLANLNRSLDPDLSSKELVESASLMLSEFSRMAGLVTLPKRDQATLRHVDFLSLDGKRVLVILVLDDHEVQNRVIYTKEPYTESQLREASNYMNVNFTGVALSDVQEHLVRSMKVDRENMNTLMKTTLEVADKAFEPDTPSDYVVNGQEHLLNTNRALDDVRQLFEAISMKGDILHLLDRCTSSEGVQLFIGNESGYEVLGECSLVTAPYHIDGDLVGVLGVIGPTRMPYDKVISIVDATSKVLSAAMEFQKK
ncbi:MAG: heat-inducible transcriptional repressor HrcA [Candidatus Azotimanducaceae bacterium]